VLRCIAHINAFIDYGDSDGLEEDEVLTPVREDARKVSRQIEKHLADGRRGEAIRAGLRCSLVGPPNAGKSSLLNILAARDAAIVSAVPGTTRDIVQVRLDLGGLPVTVDDTAGLRVTPGDEIESEGMKRSAASWTAADIRVLVLDGSVLAEALDEPRAVVELLGDMTAAAEKEAQESFEDDEAGFGQPRAGNWRWSQDISETDIFEDEDGDGRDVQKGHLIVVLNKQDLSSGDAVSHGKIAERLKPELAASLHRDADDLSVRWISCATREGIDELLAELSQAVGQATAVADDAPLITRARHRELLRRCNASLRRFVTSEFPVDVQAEDLAIALDSLGSIYGDVDVEEMLDVVFRDFCIGK